MLKDKLVALLAMGTGMMNRPTLTSMRETAYGQKTREQIDSVVNKPDSIETEKKLINAAETKRNRKALKRAELKNPLDKKIQQ